MVVHLQPTPYDRQADLVIRARVDDVMAALLATLPAQRRGADGDDTGRGGDEASAAGLAPSSEAAASLAIPPPPPSARAQRERAEAEAEGEAAASPKKRRVDKEE